MEKSEKRKIITAFILNICIILMEIAASIIGGILHLKEYGFKIFFFYTQDSNLFLFVACSIMAIYQAKMIFRKTKNIPLWVQRVKYMATCAVSLTFLVVLFVLIPLAGLSSAIDKLFMEAKLYHHFLCPLIAFISFIFFEKQPSLQFKDTIYAFVPTLIYAVIMTILNILKIAEGPYPFFKVYEQSVFMSCLWFVVILAIAYGIGVGVFYLNKIKIKEKNNNDYIS